MENALVTIQQPTDTAVADMLATGRKFLPRVQLITGSSDKSQAKGGDFPTNHFALIEGKDSYIDLGERVQAIVIAYRPMAISFSDPVVTSYDPALNDEKKATGLFAEIKAKADADSKNSGCMYGMQFLLFVPGRGFVTFFCGNATLRNEIKAVMSRLGKAATFVPKKITTNGAKKYIYFSVVVQSCSEELSAPPPSELAEVSQTFLNPPKSVVEPVDADEAKAADRG
jgi:hypothetical protein